MSSEKYDVIFSGKILPGQEPAAVRERLGKLFRVGDEQLERLFSGVPVSIKKAVDLDTAARYRDAVRKAGALVELKKTGISPDAPREPAPTAEPSAGPDAHTEPSARPDSTPESLTLAPPRSGSLEDYAQPVTPAPVPDISHMKLAPEGGEFPTPQTPPPLDVDTGGLSLLPPKTGFTEEFPGEETPPPLDVDTGDLSLLPPRTGSMEEYHEDPYPMPIPDVSHLELVLPDDPKQPVDD